MSLSSLFCVIARLVSPLPSSLRAGERRSAHTAPRPRERRARASPQTLFTENFFQSRWSGHVATLETRVLDMKPLMRPLYARAAEM